MTHPNAPLSVEGRRRLVERCLTRPISHVAAEMGSSLRSIPSGTLLATMGLVFQDVALIRDSVAENIRIGRPDAGDAEVR